MCVRGDVRYIPPIWNRRPGRTPLRGIETSERTQHDPRTLKREIERESERERQRERQIERE